jgi:UDPglucose 6-dehydrogenase
MTRPGAASERVGVLGAGYVGLATAVSLAHLGHVVRCADVDAVKVERLSRGEPTILERRLPELLAAGLASGRLRFTTEPKVAVADASFVFLCVPTPRAPDGSCDTTALVAAVTDIAPHLAEGAVVVNKSTVPIGSAALVERLIGRSDVRVVSNPEFLREGSAIDDCLHPSRVVVGATDPEAAARVGSLFAATGAPLIVTDSATAEMVKYASNAFLATKVSFVNAIANLCELLGADVRDVLLGMGYDRRIGFDYLRPGPGFGGSCLPKDTAALLKLAEEVGYDFPLLASVVAMNDAQRERVVAKVRAAVGGALGGARVAAWGVAFKAGTDDRRDSPAIEVLARIASEGASISVYDPTVQGPLPELPAGARVCRDAYEAAEGADVVVVLTEWEELRWLDFAQVRAAMAHARIVDARNLLDPVALRRLGFSYVGIGRR